MAEPKDVHNETIRLLLLEDNPSDAELSIRCLKKAQIDFDITVTHDSQEFLEQVRDQAFDLVLTDFRLPNWTALDALHALRTLGRTTPVILVTGTLGDERAIECIKAGISDYVLKENLDRLPVAINRALDEYKVRQARDRAQRELADSEKQYRLLFDANPQPMWVFDRQTLRFLMVNDAAVRHYGYSLDEFLSMTVREIRPPEEMERFFAAVAPDSAGVTIRGLWKHRKKDGMIIDVEISSQTITFRMVEAELVLAKDVTDQKRAEERLCQYEKALEELDEMVVVINRDYRYMIANRTFLQYHGLEAERVVGRHVAEVLDAKVFENIVKEKLDESFRGNVVRYDMKYVYPLFGERDLSISYFPIEEQGSINSVACVLQDVTESKRAQEGLRKSEDRYRDLVEHSQDLICTHDLQGRLLSANLASARAIGYDVAEMLQIPMRELIAPEFRGHFDQYISRMEKHQADKGLMAVLTKTGERRIWEYDNSLRTEGVSKPIVRGMARDVTERKAAEKALRESEARLNEAQQTAHLGSWRFIPEDTFIWSDEMYELFKLPRNVPVTFETTAALFHPGDRANDSHRAFRMALESDAVDFQSEYRVIWPDGQVRTLFSLGKIMRDDDGRVMEAAGTVQDVTEAKHAEETLREYARVVEGLEEMILVVDRQYRYLIANRAFLTFRGFSAEQVVGRTAEQVVGKDIFESLVKDRMDECFRGNVVQYEMVYPFPNVGKRDLFVSYFPIEGPNGIDRIACVLKDITEHKLSEEALRRSEERFSKAFRNNPLAITISTEKEGRYLDVNDAFLTMLGYKRSEVIGRTATDLHFWSEPLDRAEMLRQLREAEHVAKHHTKYKNAKGEVREAEVWAESIELDGQRCILGITRDITDIQQLEAQFRQAQKMEAVGRLAGGVAHDFNNLLGIIMGYSDLSMGLLESEGDVKKYLSEIKKTSHRGAALTQQLLAFSRKQVTFPKILDLNEIVRRTTDMFLRLVGEDIVVEFRPTRPLGSIKADPGQIEQILMNLVVNARDAMPTGGRIIIETAHAEMDEHYVEHHAGSQAGKHVMLVISDTGCGMDEKTKSQIFDPFFTTKNVGQGTGLGLSTVYGIVKQSGGYILVYSEVGRGSTFKIYFPRLFEKAEGLVLTHEEEMDAPGGSETILVVEDDKTLRELTARLLKEGGYRVVAANSAEEAINTIADSASSIDLLLTDVVMPDKNGVEIVAQAKQILPNLPVVFVSGYAGDLVARYGVLLDQDSFLEKPFTKRSLLMKVHLALHRNSASDPPRKTGPSST